MGLLRFGVENLYRRLRERSAVTTVETYVPALKRMWQSEVVGRSRYLNLRVIRRGHSVLSKAA